MLCNSVSRAPAVLVQCSPSPTLSRYLHCQREAHAILWKFTFSISSTMSVSYLSCMILVMNISLHAVLIVVHARRFKSQNACNFFIFQAFIAIYEECRIQSECVRVRGFLEYLWMTSINPIMRKSDDFFPDFFLVVVFIHMNGYEETMV